MKRLIKSFALISTMVIATCASSCGNRNDTSAADDQKSTQQNGTERTPTPATPNDSTVNSDTTQHVQN